ncbi:cation:dicarboxylase symporter family transporter [Paradesulfitobacterium aromaticivorans]
MTAVLKARFKDWLRNPWVLLGSILAGAGTGLFAKNTALALGAFGQLYLSFLSMMVIPIMGTAVITSVGRLLSSREAAAYLKRIVIVFVFGLALTSLVGLVAGITGNPGQGLNQTTRNALGNVLMNGEDQSQSSQTVQTAPQTQNLTGFLNMLIPANVFTALSDGKTLQVLFFAIVFGITVGLVPSGERIQFLNLTEVAFKAFTKAIAMAMYLLPFGLFCVIAAEIALSGLGVVLAMTKFVMLIYLSVIFLVLVGTLIISFVAKKNFFSVLSALRDPIVIAFGTSNSFAAMPTVLDTLRERFRLSQDMVNLIVPLSIVICRYSMVLVFSVGSLFMLQLYHYPIGIQQLLLIFGGSILAALAGAGAPAVVALSMISIVLTPLNLPAGAAIILLLAINPLIDPVLTILNVYFACAATLVVIKQDRQAGHQSQPVIQIAPTNNALNR